VNEDLDLWFKREILVYEAALMRFLLRAWSHRDEVDDLRQETYVRVYEAAAHSRPHAPKSFLFATARHLMTDRIRRRRVVAIDAVGDLDALNVMVDELTPEDRASAYEELRHLAEAIDVLPPRCREVVWLRRVEDMSQREVAVRLGMTQKNVEKHVMRGMKLLARALHRVTETGAAAPPAPAAELTDEDETGTRAETDR
jgi:RNA polymerase sigma factor (sigma-70 family)